MSSHANHWILDQRTIRTCWFTLLRERHMSFVVFISEAVLLRQRRSEGKESLGMTEVQRYKRLRHQLCHDVCCATHVLSSATRKKNAESTILLRCIHIVRPRYIGNIGFSRDASIERRTDVCSC